MHQKFDTIEQEARRAWEELQSSEKPQVLVGAATCGNATGAQDVIKAIRQKLEEKGIEAEVKQVGCMGVCYAEVLVDIIKPGMPRICYQDMTPEKAEELIESYLVEDDPRPDLAMGHFGKEGLTEIPKMQELPVFQLLI